MLKDYPATQLFLLSLLSLMAMVFITPFVSEWYVCAAALNSLKFITKVICVFFLFFTIIDMINLFHFKNQKHSH